MRPDKWYQRRLAKYFTEHYEPYEDAAEYWNDPAIQNHIGMCVIMPVKYEGDPEDDGYTVIYVD